VRDVHTDGVADILTAYPYPECILAQTRSVAVGTAGIAAIPAEQNAHVDLVFLGFQVLEEFAHRVEDLVLLGLTQIAERNVEPHFSLRTLLEIDPPFAASRFGPWLDGALVERKAFV